LGLVVRDIVAEGHPLSWFPDSGYVGLTDDPVQWFYHLLLPWWVLAVLFIGFYGRVMRSNILDTINEDYVRTARAKGLTPRRVLIKHVVRNSLIPVITLFGLDFGATIGGGAARASRRRRQLHERPRAGARDRRRVGLREVRHLDDPPWSHARQEHPLRGRGALQGPERARDAGGGAPRGPRQRDGDDLPGPDDLAEPCLHDRGADLRGDPGPREHRQTLRQSPRDRAPEAGRHSESGVPRGRLPASVLGRD